MARKIESLTITPSKNGGHVITHHYQPTANYTTGKTGGFSMAPASEDHVFGPGEGDAMLRHIKTNLGMGQERQAEAEVAGKLGRGMREARLQEQEVSGKE